MIILIEVDKVSLSRIQKERIGIIRSGKVWRIVWEITTGEVEQLFRGIVREMRDVNQLKVLIMGSGNYFNRGSYSQS